MSDFKSLHRLNTGVEDNLLWAEDNNVFLPVHGWSTTNMYVIDWAAEERPKIQGAAGGQTTFDITKKLDHLGPILLHFTVSAVTSTGGTYRRLADYSALACIEWIRISYGSIKICEFRREDLHERAVTTKERKELRAWENLVGGRQSNAVRDLKALGTQTFDVEIPAFWTEDIKYWFPAHAMSSELTIDVKWEASSNAVQTDGTFPQYSIPYQRLHMVQNHLLGKDRRDILSATRSEHGISYKMMVPNRQSFRIVSNYDARMELNITNLRGASNNLRVTARALADCESTVSANDFFKYQKIDAIDFEANGIRYCDDVTDEEFKWVWWPKFHRGEPGLNMYDIVFGLNPDDWINNAGTMNLGMASNKIVRVKYVTSPVPAVPMRYDVISFENNVVQIKGGDLIVMFK
jgi:hypothetical protein